jgi:hypothetical protein
MNGSNWPPARYRLPAAKFFLPLFGLILRSLRLVFKYILVHIMILLDLSNKLPPMIAGDLGSVAHRRLVRSRAFQRTRILLHAIRFSKTGAAFPYLITRHSLDTLSIHLNDRGVIGAAWIYNSTLVHSGRDCALLYVERNLHRPLNSKRPVEYIIIAVACTSTLAARDFYRWDGVGSRASTDVTVEIHVMMMGA